MTISRWSLLFVMLIGLGILPCYFLADRLVSPSSAMATEEIRELAVKISHLGSQDRPIPTVILYTPNREPSWGNILALNSEELDYSNDYLFDIASVPVSLEELLLFYEAAQQVLQMREDQVGEIIPYKSLIFIYLFQNKNKNETFILRQEEWKQFLSSTSFLFKRNRRVQQLMNIR
jgi:hypothetical protein